MSDMVERVARAIWEQQCQHWGHYRDKIPDLCPWDELTQSKQRELMREAKAAIAAMQADVAPVDEGEDWRKAWREVALLSSEHEDVRLNEAVAELHRAIEAYAHPPVDNRVSTSSPVDDRAAPETSGKLQDAVEVWREIKYQTYWRTHYNEGPDEAAVAIIEQDREAVRAEQDAEIAALKSAWEAQHKEKVAERAEAKLWFAQAQEAKTELAKFKALAEMLAFRLEAGTRFMPPSATVWHREAAEALRQYKETRDAG